MLFPEKDLRRLRPPERLQRLLHAFRSLQLSRMPLCNVFGEETIQLQPVEVASLGERLCPVLPEISTACAS